MLKQLHRMILVIVCLFALTFNTNAYANNDLNALSNATVEQMQLVHQDVKVNDLDIEPINTLAVKKGVVPDTKDESKKVMSYFLKAMLGVVLCAVFLYLLLLLIKRCYGTSFTDTEEEEYFESCDLTTPTSKQEALKTFLNRTR